MAGWLFRRMESICAVEQFPRRIQITLGGWPRRPLISLEVRVLRDQGKGVMARVVPQHRVGGPVQPHAVHVLGTRVEVGKVLDQSRR